MKRLGIDAGSYSVKMILIDDDGRISGKLEKPHHNNIKQTICDMLSGIDEKECMLAVTGKMSKALNLSSEFELDMQEVLLTGMKLVAGTKGMICVGSRDSWYIEQEKGYIPKICKNTACYEAGGAFFENLACELNMSLTEISECMAEAKSVPMITGRCNVMERTDIIQLFQEGTPKADILLGCCYAFAVNFKASVMKGCKAVTPIYLAGGLAKNQGIVRALRVMLGLKEKDIITNEMSAFPAAVGCAGRAKSVINIDELKSRVMAIPEGEDEGLAPLSAFKVKAGANEIATATLVPGEKAYLGIDIGTENISFALLNSDKKLIYNTWTYYIGNPLDIVNEELMRMHQSVHGLGRPKIAVTGYGREQIGKKIHAALITNDISAHAEGMLSFFPKIETVFEIGSLNSCYLKTNGNRLIDFELNKSCNAGLGAFLDVQIEKLGLDRDEFNRLALEAKRPCLIEHECVIAIERGVIKAIAENSLDNVCAGLAYAVAKNYIDSISDKVLSDNIMLQGGVMYNEAVVCALKALTGKELFLSPIPDIAGAVGAACLLIDNKQSFANADENREKNKELKNSIMTSLLRGYEPSTEKTGRKRIGIPRALSMYKCFPFFNRLFDELGFEVVLSPASDREIVKDAHNYVTADVCYPVRLVYGHIAWLVANKVDYIFLPTISSLKDENLKPIIDKSCSFVQALPVLMENAFRLKEKGIRLIAPELQLRTGRKPETDSLLAIGEALDIPKRKLVAAAEGGYDELEEHLQLLDDISHKAIQGNEPVFVIVTGYYNAFDPVLNMSVEKYLDELGCKFVYFEDIDFTGSEHRNLYPIYITVQGCERDLGFREQLREWMKGRQYLLLEIDEHSSGINTKARIEAFVHSIHPQTCFSVEDQSVMERRPGSVNDSLGMYNGIIKTTFEDIIARKDYKDVFAGLIEAEKRQLKHLSDNSYDLILGNPNRIYDLNVDSNELCMPLSEYILFNTMEMDVEKKYSGRIKVWKKLHDEAMREFINLDYYTDMDEMRSVLEGKLDIYIGESVRYRLGKLLLLKKKNMGTVFLYSERGENGTIVLDYLLAHLYKDIHVKFQNRKEK